VPTDRHPDADTRLAALGIVPTAEDVLLAQGPTTVVPTPTKARVSDLHEIRRLFVRRCYDLLVEPKVWAALKKHLLSDKAADSLKAFDILASGIVAATKTEESSRAPLAVNILNHIPGPPTDVTP
jgi:hypothetical protein